MFSVRLLAKTAVVKKINSEAIFKSVKFFIIINLGGQQISLIVVN